MNFFKKLLNKSKAPSKGASSEHALIITTKVPFESADLIYAVEDELIEAISTNNAGEFDGHDIAVDQSHVVLYMYGPDADQLLKVVEPILRRHKVTTGASCLRRYGSAKDPKSREVVVVI